MTRRKQVRVGLLGAGVVAQVSHLPAYARISEAAVTVICDENEDKARRVAARFNIPRVVSSVEELVALDDLDAVDICLPNHLHAEAAIAAIETGKHVLCEKPFSRGTREAEAMVAAARKQKRVLMGGFNNRYREDARLLKRFIGKGELGRVFHAKTGWLMNASSWTGESWRDAKHYAGGGVLLDLGIQMLDLTLWLLDMPEVEAVSASAHPVPERDTLETSATALLRLERGGAIALEVSWGLLMEKDMAYVNLFGDAGAALLNPLRLHKEMHGNLVNVTPTLQHPRNTYKLSYENELRHFVHCVATGGRPESPGEDALTVLRLLEAIYRSAVEGREVRLR